MVYNEWLEGVNICVWSIPIETKRNSGYVRTISLYCVLIIPNFLKL
ncbi:unnamed protein product [Brassica rapa subsp. trilocularis]